MKIDKRKWETRMVQIRRDDGPWLDDDTQWPFAYSCVMFHRVDEARPRELDYQGVGNTAKAAIKDLRERVHAALRSRRYTRFEPEDVREEWLCRQR